MLRRSLTLLAILAVAAGCATSPDKRQKIIDQEAARLRAPDVPLTQFGAFEILQVAMSPEVAAKPEKATVANQLGDELRAKLDPLLQGWAASAPGEARARKLTIQATVVSLRIVSGGARFFAGALAGDSTIDVDLELVDAQTGRAISRERISKSASAQAGGWSVGSTDQALKGYIVDIAYQYLANNHR